MHSVAEIFQLYGQAYRQKFSSHMPADQLKAMWAIENCRTDNLGIVVYTCQQCGKSHGMARSCGNRHCPTCQSDKGKNWLEKQLGKLLPCPYFFLCFTVPETARRIMRSFPRECYNAILESSAQALMTLSSNPKHIGSSRLSMTAVLHTWGRDLSYNPHVHIVAAGGALSTDGLRWLPSRVDYMVPVYALSQIYRAKVRDALEAAGLLDQFPAEVWQEEWVVHCKPVGDGQAAMKYLAPYIFRVAISNQRIQSIEPGDDGQGRVTFLYRPVGSSKLKSMPVSAEEFIRRFLQHVLPSGFRKVRHYGLASARSPMKTELLKWLVTVTLNIVYVLTVCRQDPVPKPVLHCEDCGGILKADGFIPPVWRGYDTS
jgi:Putative transposase/Transposase zinc-binding domain